MTLTLLSLGVTGPGGFLFAATEWAHAAETSCCAAATVRGFLVRKRLACGNCDDGLFVVGVGGVLGKASLSGVFAPATISLCESAINSS